MIGIYKITSPSQKVYIGQSINIQNRVRKYSKADCKNQTAIHRSILKYGWDSHVFEIVEECAFNELNKRERYWQEFYNCVGRNGLNCNLTGTDELKKVHSEETIEKIRLSNKGKKRSAEQKLKMSEMMKGKYSGENHPMYGRKFTEDQRKRNGLSKIGNTNMLGKKHSEETKSKLSKIFTGHKHTEETKRKITLGLTGRPVSIETRRKMSDSQKGITFSEERKQNISKSLMGRKIPKEVLEKRSKSISGEKNCKAKLIVNLETGIYYGCIEDAAKAHNMFRSTLNGYLVGFRKNKTSLRYA